MEPISAALTGFALLKTAVSGLKSAINTANDVKDVGHFLEAIWKADKECNEQHNKNASVGSLDTFKDVASNVIDRRLQQEMMHEVRTLITARFGIQCWETIVAEKAKREREIKEAQAAARREKIRKAQETEEQVQGVLIATFIIICVVAFFVFMFAVIARSAMDKIIL